MNKRRSISNRNVTSYHNSKDDIDDEHEIPELKEGDNTLLTWIERQDNTNFLQIHLLGMAKNHTCSSNASNTAVCFSSCKLSMQSTEPPSGYINATEFIAPLSRWVHDSKTAPRFIKYNLQPLVVKTVERNMKKQCLVPPKRRACWTCSTWNILLLHFLLKYLVKWIYCEVDMSGLCDRFSLAVRRTMNQQEELYVYCQDDGWFKNTNSRLSAEKGHLCQLASFAVHAEFKRTRSSKCAHDCPWVFGQKPVWQPAQCPGISSTMDLKRQHCLPKWPFMSFIKKLQDAFNAMVDRLDDLGDRLVA